MGGFICVALGIDIAACGITKSQTGQDGDGKSPPMDAALMDAISSTELGGTPTSDGPVVIVGDPGLPPYPDSLPPASGVYTLAGSSAAGFIDGPSDAAEFDNPVNVSAGPNDGVYVADHAEFRHSPSPFGRYDGHRRSKHLSSIRRGVFSLWNSRRGRRRRNYPRA